VMLTRAVVETRAIARRSCRRYAIGRHSSLQSSLNSALSIASKHAIVIPGSAMGARFVAGRTFKVILIKPSHYDADGYVIQWWRSLVPSNSLASMYGLMAQCAAEKSLGDDVDIDIEAYDECNTIIDIKGAIRKIGKTNSGFVGLVGVQSNQFPRALDIARALRAKGTVRSSVPHTRSTGIDARSTVRYTESRSTRDC